MHDHDLGLAHDLPRFSRRTALAVLGSGLLAACGSVEPSSSGGTASSIPEETAGPFPGDGSNGPNALTTSGVVRRDITTSFGDLSGSATGVPTTITLALDRPAAVYVWHCDAGGRYSMYDVADQNYLRGVQETGDDGTVVFDTIFPAAYSGRWPHVHFEVYESLKTATAAGSKLRTSQLAIPRGICERVYATDGYEASVANLAQLSLDSDMVFSDGYASQLATASGSPDDRIELRLDVGV